MCLLAELWVSQVVFQLMWDETKFRLRSGERGQKGADVSVSFGRARSSC